MKTVTLVILFFASYLSYAIIAGPTERYYWSVVLPQQLEVMKIRIVRCLKKTTIKIHHNFKETEELDILTRNKKAKKIQEKYEDAYDYCSDKADREVFGEWEFRWAYMNPGYWATMLTRNDMKSITKIQTEASENYKWFRYFHDILTENDSDNDGYYYYDNYKDDAGSW